MRPAVRNTALALSLAVLAACGGETTSPLTDGTPGTETSTEAAPGEADIVDFRFKPETITVPAGTEVTWTNGDATRHTVTAGTPEAGEPERFDLEVAAKGDTVSTTFDEPGTYPYYCVLHPFMLGTVEVTG